MHPTQKYCFRQRVGKILEPAVQPTISLIQDYEDACHAVYIIYTNLEISFSRKLELKLSKLTAK